MVFGDSSSKPRYFRTFRRVSLMVFTWMLVTMFVFSTMPTRVLAEEDFELVIKGIDQSPSILMPDDVNLADDLSASYLTTAASTQRYDDGHVTNRQVNDPALDNITSFPGLTRPFEFSTQSETSIAAYGKNLVVGYNSSANQKVIQTGPTTLQFTQRFLSGYSYSKDGGKSWKSGFIPGSAGSVNTFGDPSLGVDRKGNFYYASLGADTTGATTVTVSKSSDGGTSFGTANIVHTDNGDDKEWLAVGPDPTVKNRDNLYVTWTRFYAGGSELYFAKSIDGGTTWTTKAIYTPVAGANLGGAVQFSNPVVDRTNGRLYVPFLDFSNFQYDFIRVLVSDDGGATFKFLKFNVPGASDPNYFPNTTPGTVSDCGTNGGVRQVLHAGTPTIGRFGLPRYQQATRLVVQPSAAVVGGKLFIALSSSINELSGDPGAGSFIRLLYSPDGGNSWAAPVTVAASTSADPQHVHPSISIDREGEHVNVAYYAQQANEKLRVDMANGEVKGKTVKFEDEVTHLSTVAFDLAPSNVTLSAATTTNYDRSIRPCYSLGEYMSITRSNKGEDDGGVLGAWGDSRNNWVGPSAPPPPSAAPGSHPQPDVFFGKSGDD